MMTSYLILFVLLSTFILNVLGQNCPTSWEDFQDSCYKFSRSPLKNYQDAAETCRAYNSELVSVNNIDEHHFISRWLRKNDPLHRRWYTSGRDNGDNEWIWEGDLTQLSNFDDLWLPPNEIGYGSHVAYNYSYEANAWGLQKVSPIEEMAYICEISKESLHQIILLERGLDYGLTITDPEKLPRGPTFIQDAESVIYDPSTRSQKNYISLRCVADGYPAPVYRWYKEEYRHESIVSLYIDPLVDDRYTLTDGTFTIFDPQPKKDRGKYHCTASNKYGTVRSKTAQLSFGNIGEFNLVRSPDFGKENWGKSISCDPPQHYPRVNYYWTRNHFPNFVEEDQRVFVSSDGNLYFSSLEKTDQANYSCNVQSIISSMGRTGPFFSLIVESASSGQKLLFPNNFPKAFPDAPLSGQDVTLECVAYGYPVPSYNWTKIGPHRMRQPLPKGAYTTNFNRVLILPKVQVEDMGSYLCTASNGLESIQKAITLSIQASPEFTIPLGNKVMDYGATLTWTCEAFGIPDVIYRWLLNGNELSIQRLPENDKNRFRILNNVLIIEDLQSYDEGMYQCEASNQLGTALSAGQLKVIRLKPTFAKYPLDDEMYAAEGGNYTIPCRPEAAPFPTFSWRKDGITIPTGGRFRILSNGYLFISTVRPEDQGLYTCEATNDLGKDKTEGRLMVLTKPRMIEQLQPKIVAGINDSVELRCRAHAGDILDLAYIWYHNDLPISVDINPRFSRGDYAGYLRIDNITPSEGGMYRCVTKTYIGNIQEETELLVIGPPGAPGAVLAEDLTSTSAKVHWSDGSDNGRPVWGYTVEGRTNHNSTWKILVANATHWGSHSEIPDRRQLVLHNVLSPWSTYSFRVSAINSLGQGHPSEPSPQYNTDVDIPFTYPRNVGGGGGKIGSLTIRWTPLPPEEWNAEEVWYRVFYKIAENTKAEFHQKELKERGNTGHFVVFVGDENYYREYVVKVQAINKMGAGPISPEAIVFSAENLPQVQPSQVKAEPLNSTALTVSWKPLELTREKIRGKLIGYRIKYWRNRDNPHSDALILLNRGIEPRGTIVGLQPNTEYYVAVMAYNAAGSGVESEYFLARTFKAAPIRAPTSVDVRALSPTSVKVTWRGVITSPDEEPVMGYKVRYWEVDQDMSTSLEVIRNIDDLEDLEAVVTGLTPGKAYNLRVLAYSLGGDGKMSSPAWTFTLTPDTGSSQPKVESASAFLIGSASHLSLMPSIFLFSSVFLLIFK